MSLDYSEKRLIGGPLHHKRRRGLAGRLELYAFWTGFLSTLISLVQVIIIANK
ncbi:hypothetical protein HY091_00890 [Candidatus Kaiserbacteria bacterium]|nr:hypothetical protein [Candidatus Kaiserbacteria bacterium]